MERRSFIGKTLAGGAILGGTASITGVKQAFARQSTHMMYTDDLVIERDVEGQPHKGKVLAAIQPHSDDIPNYAAGLVAKLLREGYTGYLIRTTNDDHAGPGTVGNTCVVNEQDNEQVCKILGLKRTFNLDYRNHRMDNASEIELRGRFIFLFRALKIDTVVSYDPCGLYEENPDHYVTARAVEAACWMSNGSKDYPEHMLAGLKPHEVKERYYYARGPQFVNRIVDTGTVIDKKIRSCVANKAQGPAGNKGMLLKKKLARDNKKLSLLGRSDEEANYNYVKEFLLAHERELGKKHDLEYAEAYHYIGPDSAWRSFSMDIDDFVRKNTEPLR